MWIAKLWVEHYSQAKRSEDYDALQILSDWTISEREEFHKCWVLPNKPIPLTCSTFKTYQKRMRIREWRKDGCALQNCKCICGVRIIIQKHSAAHFKTKKWCIDTVKYHCTDKLGQRMWIIIESNPIAIANSCIETYFAIVGNNLSGKLFKLLLFL